MDAGNGGALSHEVRKAINSQRDYENQRETILGRGTEFLTGPIGKMIASAIGSENVRTAVEAADSVAAKSVLARSFTHDRADIAACDAAAVQVQSWAQGVNASSGALAGWFGPAGLTADVATTITLAARTVQATGACYGFVEQTEEEQRFRLLILECATTTAGKRRESVLQQVQRYAAYLDDPAMRLVADSGVEWIGEKVFDRIARQLGVSLGGRGIGRIVPFLGGAVAAAVNASFQADVARAARYSYRTRWLMAQKVLPAPAPAPGGGALPQA